MDVGCRKQQLKNLRQADLFSPGIEMKAD